MMENDSTPWHERATAVSRADPAAEATLLIEGTLLEVAVALRELRGLRRLNVRISLPDRHVPPRSFEGAALQDVLRSSERAALLVKLNQVG